MKMRKYFVMALVALGATAAFSSCQKDDKTYSDPKIEFRDANNKVITEFTKENAEIKVLVTLGDPSLKIKECKAKVLKADGEINPDLKLNFKQVKGGSDDGKFEAKFTFADTKIVGGEKNPVEVKVEVTDSKNKLTRGELKYKAKTGGETETGTPMKNENTAAYVNHANGQGAGAYSFSGKKSVRLEGTDKKDWEIYNVSDGVNTKFKAKFSSTKEAGFSFVKLNSGDVDYATATVEKVGALIKGKGTTAEIELKEGDLFIAVAKDGITFYLAKVTKVSTDGYYDGAEKAAASTAKGKGYILFSYKSNK